MNTKVLFSSEKDDWETPADLFEKYDKVYKFKTDVCASKENAKCKHYYDKKSDGLSHMWDKGPYWMNPPYGREIGEWIAKASYDSWKHSSTVVALLPVRTCTKWFHDFIWNNDGVDIDFIKGRIRFVGAKHSAPFPSMIVVFRGVV